MSSHRRSGSLSASSLSVFVTGATGFVPGVSPAAAATRPVFRGPGDVPGTSTAMGGAEAPYGCSAR